MSDRHPFQEIDHTADVGLKIFGCDLSELFIHAAQGLFSLICDDEYPWDSRQASTTSIHIRLYADTLPELLHDWLSELLYYHSIREIVFTRYEITVISQISINAIAYGSNYRENDTQYLQEIKAVTYHQLEVNEIPEGYRAQVIFDI